jgi:transmembrane sensor
MDYSNYDIEDFATDDSFIKWVLDEDPETKRFWNNFIQENPDSICKIEKAKALVINLRKAEQTHHSSLQIDSLWKRIDAGLAERSRSAETGKQRFYWTKVAASFSIIVLFLAGIGFTIHRFTGSGGGNGEALAAKDFIEEVNTTGDLFKVHLSDGSTVTLENKSRLRYPKDFVRHVNREVYLTGEGFFDIAKNPKQPFLVHTKEITTKVLGTSFLIKAYDNEEDILVSVKEGKVSVFSSRRSEKKSGEREPELNGVVLTPNQQVIYKRSEDSFNKTLVEKPEEVIPNEEQFNFAFDNVPIKKVFAALEQAYGVEIIFDEEVMQNCYLTVHMGNEPLFEKLKIVCRTIGASYEVIDATLVVTGKGC